MGSFARLVLEVFSRALAVLAAVLAPSRCAACDARVGRLAVFCPPCALTVVSGNEAGALAYGGAVARAIGRMKYESRPDLAGPLGDLVYRAIEPHAGSLRGAVVVPVPLHPLRLAERGFNQSALLAGRLARRLGARFEPCALVRTRATQPQATLDRASRATNVTGAFHAVDDERVRGHPILLVDDVMTTGATLRACEQALAMAGAGPVRRIVLAFAPQRVEEARPEQRRFPPPGGIMRPNK
jgi:ComF family protein